METRRRPCSASALLLLCFLLLQRVPSHAADILAVGRPLSGQQRLVSKRGKFALGFFQPDNSSQNWYMGIWYNQISEDTNVWVANRHTPISDPESSQLSISSDGNMVLLDRSKSPVWSTNVTSIASNSTVGVILDTGNLVLAMDGNLRHIFAGKTRGYTGGGYPLPSLVLADASNTSVVLWQSFDHFGDTWLPGGKLGRNKLTGSVTNLAAWRSYTDPTPSAFSLELDPAGTSQYLLSWNGSRQYWSSGNWTGHMFAGVPEMTATNSYQLSLYTFDYVDAADESYFVYDVRDDAVLTRFLVDVTGQIKFLTWVASAGGWMLFWAEPKAQCDVYALCGPFGACAEDARPACACLRGFSARRPPAWRQGDHADGCARDAALRCEAKSDDGFHAMAGVRLPSDARSAAAASTQECELACLADCSCTAYSYNGSCSVWFGELINLQDMSSAGAGGGAIIMIRLDASEFSSGGHARKLTVGLAAAGSVTAVLVVALFLAFAVRNRRNRTATRVEGSLMAFTYRDLQFVTKNFSEKLGGGAFGSVFEGSLPDAGATRVAVKKLEGVRQGEKQFRAEVSTIGTVQHVNLIRLLGFCSEGARRLLVYEHMPNGSLDRHLFGDGVVLSWETRYQIALGIARGLDYLHEKCRDCIIHCDIKPENILLVKRLNG